tara:strand:+ start:3596 stop:3796 length:201 start_codon:yes stop_codon:yes gene_type:complete
MINLSLALPIFFSKPIVLRAVKVAIIVGVILAFINHRGLILSANITAPAGRTLLHLPLTSSAFFAS